VVVTSKNTEKTNKMIGERGVRNNNSQQQQTKSTRNRKEQEESFFFSLSLLCPYSFHGKEVEKGGVRGW
jgi:hypothetical protein